MARQPGEEIEGALADSRAKLLEARTRRPRPHLDDKILTAWNGLMISALAKGAQVLEDERYVEAARRAAAFVTERMAASGTLLRRFRDGEAAIPGFADDYAFFVQGLLDLYETEFEIGRLEDAVRLTDRQLELFEDKENGGFFSTAAGGDDLVMRLKDDYDGAEPSANSVSISNLLRLAHMTGRDGYREAAERALRAIGSRAASVPEAVPQLLAAIEYYLARPKQIVLVGERGEEEMRGFVRAMNSRFIPNKVVLMVDGKDSQRVLAAYQPAVAAMQRVEGAATAHVCENFTCRLPARDVATFVEQLGGELG
jgi:uncharacterized protein YyaL (SSP411 family)